MLPSDPPICVYQFKITLQNLRPPVWRRLLAPSSMTLAELHDTIQTAMEWCDSHLHEFEIDGVRYGESEWDDGEEMVDDADVTLGDLALAQGSQFRYTYDFGDNWLHLIEVEAVLSYRPGHSYPVCLQGKRACPPEDIGGPWGYAAFLEAIADTDNELHAAMLEWVGGEFDPEYVDLEEINRWLASEFYETRWRQRELAQ